MTYSSKHSSNPVSRLLVAGLLCASLSGCMVGPNYHVPATPAPPAYKEPAPASDRKHSSNPVSRLLVAGLLCASLSGCMVGPNYHVPATPAPPAYKEPAPA